VKLSERKANDRFMGLFVGPPGSAKTVSAASFVLSDPDKPIYIFDLDGRVQPLLRFYPKHLDRIETDYYGPHDFEKVNRKLDKLQDIPRNNFPYSLVLFDGLTSLGDQLINYMLSLRGTSSGAEKGKERGIISLAGPEDYGGEARGLSMMLDIARSLPCHFILTAHWLVIEYDDQINKKKFIMRQLVTAGKKIAAKVPIYFDEMYYFDVESAMAENAAPKYVCRTSGGTGFSAKTALSLPPKFNVTINTPGVEPYFYEILEKHRKKAEKVQVL
jgi:hypothetical protein